MPISRFIAINSSRLEAFMMSLPPLVPCGGGSCLAPPSQDFAVSQNYYGACEVGRCQAVDVRMSALSACHDDTDCALRAGTSCCGCANSKLIAVSKQVDVESAFCGPGRACAADCVSARCRPVCLPSVRQVIVSFVILHLIAAFTERNNMLPRVASVITMLTCAVVVGCGDDSGTAGSQNAGGASQSGTGGAAGRSAGSGGTPADAANNDTGGGQGDASADAANHDAGDAANHDAGGTQGDASADDGGGTQGDAANHDGGGTQSDASADDGGPYLLPDLDTACGNGHGRELLSFIRLPYAGTFTPPANRAAMYPWNGPTAPSALTVNAEYKGGERSSARSITTCAREVAFPAERRSRPPSASTSSSRSRLPTACSTRSSRAPRSAHPTWRR